MIRSLRPRLGPITQIALALALMACTLVLVAQALFHAFGDGEDPRLKARQMVAESLALQGASLLQRGDADALRSLVKALAARDPALASIAFRRANGELVAAAGDAASRPAPSGDADGLETIRVPLFAATGQWGELELRWRRTDIGASLPGWLGEPIVLVAGFVFVSGALGFGLFMRRVLQHLDPSAAIPERVRTAFDTLVEGIVILDGEGRIVLANQAFRTLRADTDVREATPLSSLGWRTTETRGGAVHPWVNAMNQARVIAGVGMRAGDGEAMRDLQVTCSPIRDGHGAVRGCLVSFADVTEIGRANARLRGALAELERSRTEIEAKNLALERAATRDPLTDCLNRRAFAEQGEPIHQRARGRGAEPVAALLLDIDHFKSVNDRFGHATGDRVIRMVGAVLRESVRPLDLVSRHGGEEFAVLLPQTPIGEAAEVADRIRLRIADRCRAELSDVPDLKVTVSIGVSGTALGSDTLEAMIDQADTALYRAKRGGRNRVRVHDPAAAPDTVEA